MLLGPHFGQIYSLSYPKTSVRSAASTKCSGKLPGQDSNLDKENQNLLCYRYTTGYRRVVRLPSLEDSRNLGKSYSFPFIYTSWRDFHQRVIIGDVEIRTFQCPKCRAILQISGTPQPERILRCPRCEFIFPAPIVSATPSLLAEGEGMLSRAPSSAVEQPAPAKWVDWQSSVKVDSPPLSADPPPRRLDALVIHDAIRQTRVARHQPCDTDADQRQWHPVGLNYLADRAAFQ